MNQDKIEVTTSALADDDGEGHGPEGHGPEVDQGLVALLTPLDAVDDTEDDDALEELQNDLSPGEAQRVLETMRPLDADEAEILDDMPGLEGLQRVDDAEQEEWLADRTKDGYQAMDRVLDDAVYGDTMTKEEQLERSGLDTETSGSGDDLGWGFHVPGLSSLKKVASSAYKYGRKGITAPISTARWAQKKAFAAAMRFVPGRDANKARMVKNLNRKLVVEHANFLALQDQRTGRPVQPMAAYYAASRPWALRKIAAGGLPTSYVVRGATVIGADLLGGDVVGSWWNPISWFSEKSQVIVNQTQGERSATGPGGQPLGPDGQPVDPNAAAPVDPNAAAPGDTDPAAYDPSADPGATPYESQRDDMTTGISGEDSLGAFAKEILSGIGLTSQAARPVAPGPDPDELVAIAASRLRAGLPLSAGELGVLNTLAQGGNPRAQRIMKVLMTEGAAVKGDSVGAWAYMLNPVNWFKSQEERSLRAKEIDAWKRNAELQKQLAKRGEVLSQAERAKTAAEAVRAAQDQAAATEAQLKAIEASLAGELFRDMSADINGIFVGHEKPTAVSEVIKKALDKTGRRQRASQLYAKIARGESLDRGELADARQIARLLQKIKVVHGDLKEETPPELAVLHGAFVGACMRGQIDRSLAQNTRNGKVADALAKKIASGAKLTPDEKQVLVAILRDSIKLQEVTRSYSSGQALRGLDRAAQLRKNIVAGTAAAAMTPAEKKMLSSIVSLAKAGNPRAQKSLQMLKQSGMIMGGDHVGLSFGTAFKYATAPIWMPAVGVAKAAKWTGQKLGIVSKGHASPEQVRLNMMRAAAKRRAAATARARAADAQTEAELRAQESIASAADAEADAADAAALAQTAAMRTKEIEADPSQAQSSDSEDTSGDFVGGWTKYVGYDPTVKDPWETPAQKKATEAAIREKKLVARAAEKSPTGSKIRAGARLYARASKGDPQAKKAVATMVVRAQKGDAQARRDAVAVAAGKRALQAKKKAQKREARVLASRARRARVIALQKRVEAHVAHKLVRVERRVQLHRLAKIERRAAAGHRPSVAYVNKQVVAAKKGDKKAASRVQKLRLARDIRRAAPTKTDRRNLAAAGHLYARAQKGNPKAVRQLMVINAAARAGNPNAKRAVKRIKQAAVVFTALETGMIVGSKTKGKKGKQTQNAAVVARAKTKLAAGTASREELAAGARAAQAMGDRETAGNLAVAATRSPSATDTLKKTATVVAAKQVDNPEAKAAIAESFEAAKKGDPEAIRKMGNVVAVQTLDDLDKGQKISPAMRDAVNLQERVAAGDPAAIEMTKRVAEAAASESPTAEATAAAITMSAAAVTARALASKPRAREEFLEKVNAVPASDRPAAEQALDELARKADAGTITAAEGARGVLLAERLGKPKIAAKIAAEAPPPPPSTAMSSLPDAPLGPITGPVSLLKESLKAFLFATRNPLANYKEGVAGRSKLRTETPESTSGWSPFSWFRSAAPYITPLAATTAAASSISQLVSSRQKRSSPPPAPAPAPAPAAPTTTTAPAAPAAEVSEKTEKVEGIAQPPLPAEVDARVRREIAEEGVLPPEPTADKRGKVVRDGRSQPVSHASGTLGSQTLGDDDAFRALVVTAIKSKKMSRDDFNRAVEAQTGKDASPEKKQAVGTKLLAFCAKRNIKVSS
jgi:hypothetical protein